MNLEADAFIKAALAAIFDFPRSYPSADLTSIPVFSSPLLTKKMLRELDRATAPQLDA